MSTTTPRCKRIVFLVAALCLSSAPVWGGQDGDALERARQLRAVEAQRMEKEIREGRDYAYAVVRSDPGKALERIKSLLEEVEKDTALETGRRELVVRALKRDLGTLESLAVERRARTNDAVARATQIDIRRQDDPRRTAGAQSGFDTARSRIDSMAGRVADARSVRGQASDRFIGVGRSIDESNKPPLSDYDLPADWAEKSKKRSPGAKITPREKALLDALKAPLSVDFSNENFSAVIEFLQKKTGLTIIVDKQALDEANVGYDTPVTLRLPKVATRTVLKRLLADLNLTYVIKDEAIQVMTPARAKDMMVTRAYYIGDLVGQTNLFLNPAINQLQMIQAIGTIIQTVQTQVDPQSWQANNGNGTIVFDPITMTLIIKNSAEMHYMLGGGH